MGNENVEGQNIAGDDDLKGSKDPMDNGENGNPAQSAGRVSAREQDASPAPLNKDASETDPDEIPDSLSKT